MNKVKEKLIEKLSNQKLMRKIDISIFIISVICTTLIILKWVFNSLLSISYPININWVAVIMMLSLILLFGLKMLVDKKTQIAFQMILLVFLMIALSLIVGIAEYILK